MTNEELAELERLLAVANAPYDNYGQSLARKAEFSMAIFNAAPSLIATAREAEALRAENERLREALEWYVAEDAKYMRAALGEKQ